MLMTSTHRPEVVRISFVSSSHCGSTHVDSKSLIVRGPEVRSGGPIIANFNTCKTTLHDKHGAIITHEGGVEIATGSGLLVPVPFHESPSFTIEPIAGSASTIRLDGYEIAIKVARFSAPKIIRLLPRDNATNVSPDNPELSITLDKTIQIGSGNIIIENLTDKTSQTIDALDATQVVVSGNTLTITPSSNLDSFKRYAVRIEPSVIEDTNGNEWPGIDINTFWNFTI